VEKSAILPAHLGLVEKIIYDEAGTYSNVEVFGRRMLKEHQIPISEYRAIINQLVHDHKIILDPKDNAILWTAPSEKMKKLGAEFTRLA